MPQGSRRVQDRFACMQGHGSRSRGTSDFDPRIYADLWFCLDCEEWELDVAVWSVHGARTGGYTNEHLGTMWYESMPAYAAAGAHKE